MIYLEKRKSGSISNEYKEVLSSYCKSLLWSTGYENIFMVMVMVMLMLMLILMLIGMVMVTDAHSETKNLISPWSSKAIRKSEV